MGQGGETVPLPLPRAGAASWKFQASTIDQNGTAAGTSFRFSSGSLELESAWLARPGGGPVESQVTIRNTAATAAVFDSSLLSVSVELQTPPASVYSQFEKRGAGTPLPPMATILRSGVNESIPTGGPGHSEKEGQYIPLAVINAADAHGLYIGSEWELGQFDVRTTASGSSGSVLTSLDVAPIGAADLIKQLPEDCKSR